MGVFKRSDSKYWWLWLETAPPGQQKIKTAIPIGEGHTRFRDSKKLAEAAYVQHMHEIAVKIHRLPDRRVDTYRLEQAIDWYEQHVLPHHRGQEREREILKRWREEFGYLPVADITKERIIEWRTHRAKTPTVIEHFGGPNGPQRTFPAPGPRTINREVDVLQQVLSSTVPKYLPASPLAGLADLKVTPPIRRTMSQIEEARLLAELSPEDRAIFLVGVDTLTRLTDILDLKRTDDQGRTLIIRDPKNRQPHLVPISQRLRAALDAVPVDDRKPEWYFPGRRRALTERDRRGGYVNALYRACERAGIPYGRKQQGITFHWATRRTGATRMIRAGGDGAIATTQRIGNWKDPSVLIGIYQETITAEMEAAVEAVGSGVTWTPTSDKNSRFADNATRGSIPESFPSPQKLAKKNRKS